jgi:hypothetical protein
MKPVILGAPFTISGQFDADVAVDIVAEGGWTFAELSPFCGDWTQDEIARVHAIRAVPELLDALRAIRKIGYESKADTSALWEAMLKCIDIAEHASGAAEPTGARRRARASQKKEQK